MPAELPRLLVMVADVPEGAEAIKNALGGAHDLVIVHSLSAAVRLIANVEFDAVIAGSMFDDSRMIELLRAVRGEVSFQNKPFIVVRTLPTTMPPEMEANSKQITSVLGANAFITVDEFATRKDFDTELQKKLLAIMSPSANR